MARSLNEYLVWLLSRREYSRKELASKSRHKYPDLSAQDIDQQLDRLEDLGWQSDQRYCQALFRMRATQGRGLKLIRQELTFKGIASEIIDRVVSEFDTDWVASATAQITKKFPAVDPSDPRVKHKVYQFLSRKGFSPDEIGQSLQNLHCD